MAQLDDEIAHQFVQTSQAIPTDADWINSHGQNVYH